MVQLEAGDALAVLSVAHSLFGAASQAPSTGEYNFVVYLFTLGFHVSKYINICAALHL